MTKSIKQQRSRPWLLSVLVCAVLGACKSGPDYQRPALDLPQDLGAHVTTAEPATAALPGDHWWESYGDPVLNALEQEALVHNADLKVAASRVIEAQAQLGISEADQLPTLSANLSDSRTKNTLNGVFPRPATLPRIQNYSRATLNASYELDLWGKLRRANEAARAQLLAFEASRDAVRLSMTAQVAQQYFALLAYDAQEVAVRRALAGRQQILEMDKTRVQVGVLSELNFHQAQAEEAAVRSQLATLSQVRGKQEAALALLLGRSPREVMSADLARGQPKSYTAHVPAGLSAELLLRRPDLKQAEQNLIALNARIGVARAQYFPSISLTAYDGYESTAFASLFTGASGVFQFAAGLSQPIFNAGRIGNSVKVAEAARDQAVVQYQHAVASAFADVRNALSAQTATQQVLEAESLRTEALAQAYQQASLRYQSGVVSQLELLDIERSYLQAELLMQDALRSQRAAVADLFMALGGGW
ncbi:Outer membrane protein OprM [Ferriphaselus amnicola]|uniref:Outer membrane protein OprM n=1 Tax=Ferriphaselus amnicola TaxID=1188319 RepID=A0A2Z6GE39_9PROT|nr:efflux transporter outer membrane subunit [Ferriphaselus amnicola]BBE51846.1 Outer membrane protein OprM [Ferriphaselus amnicola]